MHQYRQGIGKYREPLWFPASNYYFLTAAISGALFFLIWGVTNDGSENISWLAAGIASGLALAVAVFVREVILRSARDRFLSARRLDNSVRSVTLRSSAGIHDSAKLTLESNTVILREIRQKSDAAKILGKFSEAHREVVVLCEEYLVVAALELPKVRAGSPRIAAFRKGSEIISRCHRYHLLQWAEIEARALTQEARMRDNISEKLDTAQKALRVVDLALRSYPDEKSLLDSKDALQDFLSSISVTNWIEKAERAYFKGYHETAISFYQDALFDLTRNDIKSRDRELVGERILVEIKRIEQLLQRS